MIGQAVSIDGKKYNVIILAGGLGTRMGDASDYLPKALSKIGNKRAIDYIIEKYIPVAHKFVIGTGSHADLLEGYLRGVYQNIPMEFSREDVLEMKNNAVSTTYCLDHCNSKYGTIIAFCDLIVLSNNIVDDNSFLLASSDKTFGNIGSFRHTVDSESSIYKMNIHKEPIMFSNLGDRLGILGSFFLSDTVTLKAIAYTNFYRAKDLTEDIIRDYNSICPLQGNICSSVYEFGNENDLKEVRRLWENAKY